MGAKSAYIHVLHSRIPVVPSKGEPRQPPYHRRDTAFQTSSKLIKHKNRIASMLEGKDFKNRWDARMNFCVASKLSEGTDRETAIKECKESINPPEGTYEIIIKAPAGAGKE